MERISNRHKQSTQVVEVVREVHHNHKPETIVKHVETVKEVIVEVPVEKVIYVDRPVEKVVHVEADISHVEDAIVEHRAVMEEVSQDVDSLDQELQVRRRGHLLMAKHLRRDLKKQKALNLKLKLAVGASLLLSIIALLR